MGAEMLRPVLYGLLFGGMFVINFISAVRIGTLKWFLPIDMQPERVLSDEQWRARRIGLRAMALWMALILVIGFVL